MSISCSPFKASGFVVFPLILTTAFGKLPLTAVSQLRSIAATFVWAVFPSPFSVWNKMCCPQRRLFGRPGRCRTFLSPPGQHQMPGCRTGSCTFPCRIRSFYRVATAGAFLYGSIIHYGWEICHLCIKVMAYQL